MKLSDGFSVADSRNLPKLEYLMLMEYMKENDCFNAAEIRGAKVLFSTRDAYVDSAVGYVEVRREMNICTVKGKVTPEHKVRAKLYTVTARIDESEDKLLEVNCIDCAASEGGCKHAICFAMWLIKKGDEPSVTSVSCYWTQPKLSMAIAKDKFIKAEDLGRRQKNVTVDVLTVPTKVLFLTESKKRKLNDALIILTTHTNKLHTINYTQSKETLDKYSLYDIALQFQPTQHNTINVNDFIAFANGLITPEVKTNIEKSTRKQSDSKLWHTLRQGRVTASNIYEASKCKTDDGSLVNAVLGGYKVPETIAIKRGKTLEKDVLQCIETDLGVQIKPCGLMLITPIIGASPDGIHDDFIIEVKCPMSSKSMENYVNNGNIKPKYCAQLMLQMHASGKKKGLFCLADPKYETNKKYYKYWIDYNKKYTEKLLSEGEAFWNEYIFNKLMKIVIH